jgi:hypothetical protein
MVPNRFRPAESTRRRIVSSRFVAKGIRVIRGFSFVRPAQLLLFDHSTLTLLLHYQEIRPQNRLFWPFSFKNHVVIGNGHIVTGTGRVVTGTGRVVTGNGHVVTGNGRVVIGNGHVVTGKGYVVTGKGWEP